MGCRLREPNAGVVVLEKGVMLRFVSCSVSCRVIRTYVSPLSLSAVSSHVTVRLLIPRTLVIGFLLMSDLSALSDS